MITWSRKRTLIAGLALIVVTNSIALIGVHRNRSGDPESVLRLTERELNPPYRPRDSKENSGMVLQLKWRVLDEGGSRSGRYFSYPGYGGEPAWLDEAKLEELGFDTSIAHGKTAAADRSLSSYDKQLPREALLVLELDGATYQRALTYVTEQAEREITNAGTQEIEKAKTKAKEWIERETLENSRLFVIDAGLDEKALRKKYPDVTHYAIVHGQVRVNRNRNAPADKLTGYVSDLNITRVNVPFEFRDALDIVFKSNGPEKDNKSRFFAMVSFGKRFEPWITAVGKN